MAPSAASARELSSTTAEENGRMRLATLAAFALLGMVTVVDDADAFGRGGGKKNSAPASPAPVYACGGSGGPRNPPGCPTYAAITAPGAPVSALEPTTMIVAGTGLLACYVMRRRR
jgi:hypothetical protein